MRNIKIQLYIIKNKRDIKDVFYKRYFQKKDIIRSNKHTQ